MYPTIDFLDEDHYESQYDRLRPNISRALRQLANIVDQDIGGDQHHRDTLPSIYLVVFNSIEIIATEPDAKLYISDSNLYDIIDTNSEQEIFPLLDFVHELGKLRILYFHFDNENHKLHTDRYPREIYLNQHQFDQITRGPEDIVL